MARPKRSEATKLALALEELHAQIGPNQGVVRGQQIKNATRVFLLEKGFLREILSRGGTSFQTQVLTRATARCFTLTYGLRCMSLPYCLIRLPPRLYQTWQKEIQIVLGTLADSGAVAVLVAASELGTSRVVASFRQVGRKEFADRIERELAGSGSHLPQVRDPFEPETVYQLQAIGRAPLYARVKLLWKEHREEVLAMRAAPPLAWKVPAFSRTSATSPDSLPGR